MSYGLEVFKPDGTLLVDYNGSVPLLINEITITRGSSGSYTGVGFTRVFGIQVPLENRNVTLCNRTFEAQLGNISINGNVINWNNNYTVQRGGCSGNVTGILHRLLIYGVN